MNPLRSFGFAAILAGALLAAAPAHAQRGDEEARRQLADQSRRIEDLRQQVTRMEESLRSMSAANPALGLADQLEGLRKELTSLRGQIEVLGNDVQMSSKRTRDMYVDLDTRMKRLEQPTATGATPPAGAPAAGVAA
ncbi:MAG: YbgF trimerization domain-containing protein, partial [Burkholderiales bacterium]